METIRREFIPFTPEKAQQIMLKNTYPGQRKIKDRYIKKYIHDLEVNRFFDTIIIVAQLLDGTWILIDGQHRLLAVIESGITMNAALSVIKCKNDFEVSQLWKKYDGGKTRSYSEMAESEAGMLGLEWKSGISSLVGSAAHYLSGKGRMHKEDKAELIRQYIDEGNFIDSILSSNGSRHKHVRRFIVVAAMITTFQANHKDAKTFWEAVKTGELLTRTDPAWHLREFLINISMTGHTAGVIRMTKNRNKKTDGREIYNRCISAWNKFRANKEIKQFRYKATEQLLKAA